MLRNIRDGNFGSEERWPLFAGLSSTSHKLDGEIYQKLSYNFIPNVRNCIYVIIAIALPSEIISQFYFHLCLQWKSGVVPSFFKREEITKLVRENEWRKIRVCVSNIIFKYQIIHERAAIETDFFFKGRKGGSQSITMKEREAKHHSITQNGRGKPSNDFVHCFPWILENLFLISW